MFFKSIIHRLKNLRYHFGPMIPFLLDKLQLLHLAALEQDEILQVDEKLEKAVDEVLDGVEWVIEE